MIKHQLSYHSDSAPRKIRGLYIRLVRIPKRLMQHFLLEPLGLKLKVYTLIISSLNRMKSTAAVYKVRIRDMVSFYKYVTVCGSQERQRSLRPRRLYCTTNYSLTLEMSSCMKWGSAAGTCCKVWIQCGCSVFRNVYVYLEADNHCGIKSPLQLDTEADTVGLCRLQGRPVA